MKATLQVKKLYEHIEIPESANFGDAGLDLRTRESVTLQPGQRALLGTGLAFGIPYGYFGHIRPRSKLAAKWGLDILAGIVDSGYVGEVMVSLINHGKDAVELKAGDKVAQMIIQESHSDLPIVEVEELRESDRGTRGINDSELRLR